VLVDKGDLYKGKPVKKLTQGLTKSGGRAIPVMSHRGIVVAGTSAATA